MSPYTFPGMTGAKRLLVSRWETAAVKRKKDRQERQVINLKAERRYQKLLDVIFSIHAVTDMQLSSKSRRKPLPDLRRVITIAMYEPNSVSFEWIGEKLNKDHTSVIHSYETGLVFIRNNDEVFKKLYDEIIAYL